MKDSIVFSIIQNIAILMTFCILYDHFWSSKTRPKNFLFKLLAGVFLALVVFMLISTPWDYKLGIFFDTRSVMLSVAGLFFGPVPTITATILTAIYRIYLGGSGVYMGIAVIFTSGAIGLLWYYLRPDWKRKNHTMELLSLGLVVHSVMLACIMLLPQEIRIQTLKLIFFPVMILYPLATVLIGEYIIRQETIRKNKKALIESEKRWQFALEGAGDGIWDWDLSKNEIFFSKQWKNLLGYKDDEIEKTFSEWENRMHVEDRKEIKSLINLHLEGKTPIYSAEYRMQCKDGSYKWILDRGKVIQYDNNGNPIRFIGTQKDISERKHREMLLAHEQYLVNALMENTTESVFFKDLNSRYIRVNKAFANSLGYPDAESIIGKSDFDLFSKEYAKKTVSDEQEIIQTNKTFNEEGIIKLQDGTETWILTNKMPLKNPNNVTIGTFGISINIDEQKRVETALKDSQEQLKKFAAHLQSVREEERVLLAREIHDELGQILIALKIDLGMLKQEISVSSKINKKEIEKKINQILSLLDNTIKTTRRIMTGLRPETLELMGLNEAIKLYSAEFEERHKIFCSFESTIVDRDIDDELSVALFRILQEALTNVIKHSKASEVKIRLEKTSGKILMEIADNGIGIDKNIEVRKDSYGLIGMRERVLILDGNISIEGDEDSGTTIKVEIPYKQTS